MSAIFERVGIPTPLDVHIFDPVKDRRCYAAKRAFKFAECARNSGSGYRQLKSQEAPAIVKKIIAYPYKNILQYSLLGCTIISVS